MEAETIGINEAMSWVIERTNAPVCIKSDSLSAVQAINGGSTIMLEIDHIFYECRQKLISRRGLTVTHVRRLGNRTTHFMARSSCELNIYVDFMSPPPLSVGVDNV